MPSKKPTTIDEYINTFPESTQTVLQKTRKVIRKAAPEATEKIGYGLPAFHVNGAYLIYLGGWQEHISLYPVPTASAALERQMQLYKSGKGTLRFPLDKPIPYDLITQIVKARLVQTLAVNSK